MQRYTPSVEIVGDVVRTIMRPDEHGTFALYAEAADLVKEAKSEHLDELLKLKREIHAMYVAFDIDHMGYGE